MVRVTTLLVLFAVLAGSGAAAESWPSRGVRLAASDPAQTDPAIVSDSAGGVYVCWSDARLGGTTTWAQRLGGDGLIAPDWPLAGLPVLLKSGQAFPSMAADGQGGMVVATGGDGWYGTSYVSVGRIGPAGIPRAGWPDGGILVYADFLQAGPAPSGMAAQDVSGVGRVNVLPSLRVETDGTLRLAYSYMSFRGNPNTYVGRFEDGVPAYTDPWPVVTCPGYTSQLQPLIAPDGGGGDFVVWTLGMSDPAARTLNLQHVNANGSLDSRWPVCGVPVAGSLIGQDAPGILADGAGGAYVVWLDRRNGEFERLYAQRFKSNGVPADGWPPLGRSLTYRPAGAGISRTALGSKWRQSALASDGAGGLYVAWTDLGSDAGDIHLQRVRPDGSIAYGWPVGGVAVCARPGAQVHPTVAADGSGGCFVAWQDSRDAPSPDIYVQRVTSSGAIAVGWSAGGDPVIRDPVRQESPVVAAGAGGEPIVAWLDWRSGEPQIYAGMRRAGDDTSASENRHGARILGGPRDVADGPVGLELQAVQGGATLKVSVPGTGSARLRLVDIAGRRVDERWIAAAPGSRTLVVNRDLPPGIYLAELSRGDERVVTRTVVLR